MKGYRCSFSRQVEPKVRRILTRKIMERLSRGFLADTRSLLNRYVNDTSRESAEMFNSHRLYFHQPVEH